ncbi:molybdopterin molybdotransferase MoeA [Oceanobacter sp. 5_MG-2023]|uniref:molybdopterin molybdotransferase MoeA n=1 Tax=Oceanobacter sp. 5_MG-2023 TaxID=3062645 RepID=UPI0026E26117|nr:gephyrin-like molybdotransferase Glp [Oceanobacter sp. 5_MG-2023]MDO6682339.1 molybdopterin molybdotransferase MoeA [Oceanobacter sp. 5_MG-2023]
MASCDAPGLQSLDEALEQILSSLTPLTEEEWVPLSQADGRILAADVQSCLDLPPTDNSAMDGYAVRVEDLTEFDWLDVNQRILAGDATTQPILPGECARIMTGAMLPEGANTVIMQEDAELDDDGKVRFLAAVKPSANIRRRGEEVAVGDIVLAAGRRLRAADIGLLASLGIDQVVVRRRVRVAIMATGNELVTPGQSLQAGQIYESNSQVLAALLVRLGCTVIHFGIIADDPQALRQAYQNADSQADLVIASGGVSVGEADFSKQVLDELGQVGLWKLAIKPGKPFAFGRLPNSWFAGLPGNPVSTMVTFDQLVVPILTTLAGDNTPPRLALRARLTCGLHRRPGRLEFQRAVVSTTEDGVLQVTPLARQGSALLSTMSAANAYILLDGDSSSLEKGQPVRIELFDGLLL